jgi:hypothetical protein
VPVARIAGIVKNLSFSLNTRRTVDKMNINEVYAHRGGYPLSPEYPGHCVLSSA